MSEDSASAPKSVYGSNTEEEAVRLANDSPYGLSAYVFTRDKTKADRIANQLLAGTVMHNDTLYTHAAPETPWGGVKASGLGRVEHLATTNAGGPAKIDLFVTVVIARRQESGRCEQARLPSRGRAGGRAENPASRR